MPGSTCVGCGGKIVSLLSSASDNIMPGSVQAQLSVTGDCHYNKLGLCLEVFFLAKLRSCVSAVVTILMVKRIPVKNSE